MLNGANDTRSALSVRAFGRPSAYDLEYRHVAAHAHRNLRRTRAPLAHLLKVVLYDTVLERVIRDDADASSRVEPPGGGVKPSLKHIEFVIDLDANGLETFLGRVPTMPTSGSWDTRLDDLDKLAGGLDRFLLAATHDFACDLRGELLFAIDA